MYAKIALMGHTTVIGKVRQSARFPGLIEVHPFYKDGDVPPKPSHYGPGAVFSVHEMSKDAAAIEWCRQHRIDLDHVQGTRVFWTAQVPEPMSVAPAAPEWHINGHVFKAGCYVCDNPLCCIGRRHAVDHSCSSHQEPALPVATINSHVFLAGQTVCFHDVCNITRIDAELYPCPTLDVPF